MAETKFSLQAYLNFSSLVDKITSCLNESANTVADFSFNLSNQTRNTKLHENSLLTKNTFKLGFKLWRQGQGSSRLTPHLMPYFQLKSWYRHNSLSQIEVLLTASYQDSKLWKPFIIYWSITLEGRLAKKGLFVKLTLVIQLSMESVWSCSRISEMADMDSRTEVSREMSCPSIKAMFKSSSSTVFQNNILEDVLIKITHFPNKIYT